MAVLQDLRYAIRRAHRAPVFTGIAVVVLAIGIGATTAVFSLAHALLLRSLPVPEPQDLIRYRLTADGPIPGLDLPPTFLRDFGLSGPMFDALRATQQTSVDLFAWMRADGLTVVRRGQRFPVRAAWASGATFRVLNIGAAVGRLFEERDDRIQGPDGWTAIVSYRYWTETWNRDPNVVGQAIVVEELPLTIIGVLPASFSGVLAGDAPQLILPLGLEPVLRGDESLRRHPGTTAFTVIGRLRPGHTLASASAELAATAARVIDEAVPQTVRDDTFNALRLDVQSGRAGWSSYRLEYERPLRQIQLFSGIVLLVIGANLAGLLFAQSASRQWEFAIRAALGASRRTLLRQLLVEHVLLAAMAVPLGCGIAFWLGHAAVAFFGQSASIATDAGLSLDLRPTGTVMSVAVLAGLASMLIAAAAPSLWVTSRSSTPALRRTDRSPRSVGRVLMPVQIALSVVLIALAISASVSIVRLLSTPAGMNADGVMMASPDLRGRTERGPDRLALYQRILSQVTSGPGIRSATMARQLPMSGGWNDAHYVTESVEVLREDRNILQNIVGPGFFRTFGIRTLAGRDFAAGDRSGTPAVCILNQSAASYFFPGLAPIGRHVERRQTSQRAVRCEVIGVVEDAKFWTLNQEPPRTVYRPFAQEPIGGVAFVAKGDDLALVTAAFRTAFAAVLPGGTVVTPLNFAEQTLASVSVQRALAWIAGGLGFLALLLTCVSLYGQVAWNVTHRTREFGIRLALGETPYGIVLLLIRDLGMTFMLGMLAGLGAVVLVSQFVMAVLYKTAVVDPLPLTATLIALGLACAAAAYVPARRAARVEPAVALRNE